MRAERRLGGMRQEKGPAQGYASGANGDGERLLCLLISILTIAPPTGVNHSARKDPPERGQLPVSAAAMSATVVETACRIRPNHPAAAFRVNLRGLHAVPQPVG